LIVVSGGIHAEADSAFAAVAVSTVGQ